MRKLTKQRQVILEAIENSQGHMTADEIHSKLKEQGDSVGIATIYRNLNVLYEDHLINRVRHPEFGFIYDKNTYKHYHLHCVQCNKIEDVDLKFPDSIKKEVESALNCKVLEHELTFEGICSDCSIRIK